MGLRAKEGLNTSRAVTAKKQKIARSDFMFQAGWVLQINN